LEILLDKQILRSASINSRTSKLRDFLRSHLTAQQKPIKMRHMGPLNPTVVVTLPEAQAPANAADQRIWACDWERNNGCVTSGV
jgi:hypothetical protein